MYFVPGAALPFPISEAKRGTGYHCGNLMKDMDWEGYVVGKQRRVREILDIGEFEGSRNRDYDPFGN